MQIEENKPLDELNTFGIAVGAKYFVEVKSIEDFIALTQNETYKSNKKLVLGGGSNILFTACFDGIVIKNSIEGISIVSETEHEVIVKANAGEKWHEFVLYCIEHNYAGIENLSLIPGLVGAAPMQNIGAYGVEIKDVFHELEALDMITGELTKFSLADCGFGYRESVFKNKFKYKYFIASVSFKLTKLSSPRAIYHFKTDYGDIKHTLSEMQVYDLNLKAVSDAVCKIRSSKLPDPKVLGNAGSFFKNPSVPHAKYEELVAKNPVMPSFLQKDGTVKIPAGWLIEQCGWKGKVVGNTGSHKSQALVLVNYGNATGNEVWNLALEIKKSVLDKFGIDITPEVNVV
ncbi:MAG TPA: UDP-N-acetylmuramate dehydrogenase [Chitinophagales bacterium]|nr:UDP-N-acetylmuramate dehydrogenase [Chitinophagales bacterium]